MSTSFPPLIGALLYFRIVIIIIVQEDLLTLLSQTQLKEGLHQIAHIGKHKFSIEYLTLY